VNALLGYMGKAQAIFREYEQERFSNVFFRGNVIEAAEDFLLLSRFFFVFLLFCFDFWCFWKECISALVGKVFVGYAAGNA